MKKLLITLTILTTTISYAQVGIGTTTPDNSAALEISSTNKGLLLPRLTDAQIRAISNPAVGLLVFCTDCSPVGMYIFDGDFFTSSTGNGNAGINTVTGAGGATWMDRNLGASQVATGSSDTNAFGYLYQWGRNTDGHQIRTSSNVMGPVASGSEGSNFIAVDSSAESDWLSTPDATRWNGTTKGVHDPCPSGYRVPTSAEWTTESNAWNTQDEAGAIGSPLQLPSGYDRDNNGFINTFIGSYARYWSSTAGSNSSTGVALGFGVGGFSISDRNNFHGYSVRCIQE